MCTDCADGVKKTVKCPRGHLMPKYGGKPVACDKCGIAGTNFRCCKQCDYELCDSCSKK